jgi:hypothetical protein
VGPPRLHDSEDGWYGELFHALYSELGQLMDVWAGRPEGAFATALQELCNGVLTVKVKSALGQHNINWGRLARCYSAMPDASESGAEQFTIGTPAGWEQEDAEIAKFCEAEKISRAKLVTFPWPTVATRAEKAGLSFSAMDRLRSGFDQAPDQGGSATLAGERTCEANRTRRTNPKGASLIDKLQKRLDAGGPSSDDSLV